MTHSLRTLSRPEHRGAKLPSVRLRQVPTTRQSGLSIFSFLMWLIALALVLNVGLTLGPHYMENRSITQVVESINPSVWKGSSKKKIHDVVNKRLKVNNVRSLTSEDIISIEKKKSGTIVKLDYEVRENILANVDAVLVFNKEYTH